MFINTLSRIVKLWRELKYPLADEWIKKLWGVCVCVCVYYSAIKKNKILPFATTWMELECIMLSKISQSEREGGRQARWLMDTK